MRAPPAVVLVQPGMTATATAQLAPVTGSILIDADEPRALIEIDGKPAGFTPAVVREVPVGLRKIRVSLHGFEPVTLIVNVEPDQQAAPPQISLAPLHEVEAVSRYAQDVDDAPSSVTLISREEIQAFGYPTLAEALRGVRGFTISDDHAYPSASVRGLGQPEDYGNRLLILQDGASLNDDIDNASDIGVNGRVDLADIQRIEVVRGPGSLLYGAGALSGVVNVVTRPRDGADSIEGGFGVFDGTAMHARAALQRNFGGLNLWGSASGAQSDGSTLEIPGAGVAQGVDAFSAFNTQGRVSYGPVTAQWFFNRRNQSVPVGAYGTEFNNPDTRLNDTRALGEIRFEPKLTDSLQLLVRLHANRYASSESFASDPAAYERYEGNWYGAEARLIWSLGATHLTLGGEAQNHPVVILRGQTNYAEGAQSYLDEHAPYHFSAGYVMADAKLGERFILNAGVRVDNYSTFGAIAVPRGALIAKPWKGATLKLMGGRAFRAPSIYELTYNDGGATQARAQSLDPESIWSGEFELTQRFATDWAALIGGHLARAQDLIGAAPDSPGSTVLRFQNSATPVLLTGADFEIRREWRRQWMFSASYEYQVAKYQDSSLADAQLVNAPMHLASAKLLAPVLSTVALLGVRATLEAPRRISLDSSLNTGTSMILDVTMSGSFGHDSSLHYVFGVYNLADQRTLVPVSETFASPVMPQNGRTLLFQLDGRY
jgi:outer membrane receptor for ferrienterochelin and colicins